MNKYLTEFLGTFFLVMSVGLASGNLAVLIIAATLMVMIYAGGHLSGAHYNPAVTLAVAIRGKCSWKDAFAYWLAQFLAAIVAAFVVMYFKEEAAETMVLGSNVKAFVSELLGTFALVYVVLNVATAKGTSGNSFYGLAIGFTVFAMGSLLGNYSGGAFNPAVAVGATIMNAFDWNNIWIYLLGCFGAAVIAAFIFKVNNPTDK
ncbi:MAG TPA: aquaporin [Chitinophagaceae bacterium]|nr:aquaporin [Chitinophagaceae bacterium]